MDLNMLAVAVGKERALAEFDALLAKAGLRRIAVQTSDSVCRVHKTRRGHRVGLAWRGGGV